MKILATLRNPALVLWLVAGCADSSTTTEPSSLSGPDAGSPAMAAPCALAIIDVDHNGHLFGNVQLGTSGSVDPGLQVTGSTTHYSSLLAAPSMPAWSPGVNPGGIPQNYTVSSNTTLPGGTYWFTALNIDNNLTFSGPATVYINGNVRIDSDLTAYGNIPANLTIYQLGANRTFGDSKANNLDIVASTITICPMTPMVRPRPRARATVYPRHLRQKPP